MKGEESDLFVSRSGRDIVLANKDVRLRLIYRDGGYVQEFCGVDRTGEERLILSTIHRDLIPFTEHRTHADPMFSGHRQHLFELSRESIRLGYTEAKVIEDGSTVAVKLTGGNAECGLASTITLFPGSKFVKVTADACFLPSRRPHLFEYLMSAFAFLPDGMLLDRYGKLDYAWSPVLRPEDDHIVAERSFGSAVVLAQHRKLAAAIIPERERTGEMPLALDIDLRNGVLAAPILACGFCDSVPDGHFSRHDRGMVFRPEPGAVSYSFWIYIDAEAKSRAACEPVQEFLWRRARRGLYPTTLENTPSDTSDDLATAYAIKSRPKSVEDVHRANRAIAQMLGRQRPEGVFDLDTATTSQAMRWMLAIHRDFGGNTRLLAACTAYGDFLVANQSANGGFALRFSEDLAPLPELKDTLESAAAGRFLAGLYKATGERRYLAAAARVMKLTSTLVSRCRFHDKETFLAGVIETKDVHTCVPVQGANAMRHAADLAIAMYRLTEDSACLKTGQTALNQMLWLQDTWSEHPGAFSPGNAFDGPVAHGAFARTLLEYYQVTKRVDLIERSTAALHSGIALGDSESAGVQCWSANRFASALIDVRGRAAYVLGPCRIDGLSIASGSISFDLRDGGGPNPQVRFSGLRGRNYRLQINGEVKQYSKVELESGITVPVTSSE